MPITRRDFVKGAGVGAGSLALGVSGAPAAAETPAPQSTARRLRCFDSTRPPLLELPQWPLPRMPLCCGTFDTRRYPFRSKRRMPHSVDCEKSGVGR